MIYYFRDSYAILEQCRRLLTNNGLIFIATINPQSTLYKHYMPFFREYSGTTMLLSKKNYEMIHNKTGLKLIDYSIYRADYYIDTRYRKYKKLNAVKYFFKLKKPYVQVPNGNHAFILLENNRNK